MGDVGDTIACGKGFGGSWVRKGPYGKKRKDGEIGSRGAGQPSGRGFTPRGVRTFGGLAALRAGNGRDGTPRRDGADRGAQRGGAARGPGSRGIELRRPHDTGSAHRGSRHRRALRGAKRGGPRALVRVRGILREVCDSANVDDGLRCRREWSNDGMSRRFEVERPREKNIPIEPSFSDVFVRVGANRSQISRLQFESRYFFQIAPTKIYPAHFSIRSERMRTLKFWLC